MSQFWYVIDQHFRFADALDIAVGTILLTVLFHWLRRRSTRIAILVLFATAVFYLAAHALRMYLMMAMFRTGLLVILFSLIVLFQEDIRNGIEQLTTWPPFRSMSKKFRESSLETLTQAIELLAGERTGALIVLPARENLERHVQGGVVVDGELSVPLLHSIFHSASQGHDGAVILRENRIGKLGVHLPLSTNFEVLGARGTRHAAALGLAERSDALVVVVSEERGDVSIAKDRGLTTLANAEQLKEQLHRHYQNQKQTSSDELRLPGWMRSLAMGTFAFVMAVFFWYLAAMRVESVQRMVDEVPIEAHNLPPEWVVESIQPQTVRVNLTGSERAFAAYDWSRLKINLDLSEFEEGTRNIVISEDAIDLPQEMMVLGIEPNTVRVTAYQTEIVELPVTVRTQGQPPEGMRVVSLTPSPDRVSVRVHTKLRRQIRDISTEPLDLSDLQSTTRELKLRFPPGIVSSAKTPSSIRVRCILESE